MHPITVYLADDHQIVIKGISSVVQLDPELKLVGFTTDSTKIIEEISNKKPQVLVLDMAMPEIPGIEIIRTIRRRRSFFTRIVVFSMHKDVSYVAQALQEGALGFVVKDVDTAYLIQAIKTVARKQQYLSPPFTEQSVQRYLEQVKTDEDNILEHLTRREREVLILIAQGHSNSEIAGLLGISVRTVEKHRFNMMKKTDFKNKIEITQFAIQQGLVDSK